MSDRSATDGPPTRSEVEWLPQTTGPFGAVLGFVAALAVGGLALADLGGPRAVAGLLLAGFVAAATWAVLLRPRVGLTPRPAPRSPSAAVVVRGMVSTTHVPLVELTGFDVRQVLVLRADGRRHLSPAVGRSRARLLGRRTSGSPGGAGLPGLTRLHGYEPAPAPTERAAPLEVADLVLQRLDRARDDARLHRLPGGPATRAWAWPEIVVLLVTGLGSLGAFLV